MLPKHILMHETAPTMPLNRFAVKQGRMRSSQACNGHPKWRTRYVCQTELMTNSDGLGVAAVFSADADLETRACGPAGLHCHLHQLAAPLPLQSLARPRRTHPGPESTGPDRAGAGPVAAGARAGCATGCSSSRRCLACAARACCGLSTTSPGTPA